MGNFKPQQWTKKTGTMNQVSRETTSRQLSRTPSLTSLIALVLIMTPLLYVVSYAPVVRWNRGVDAPDSYFWASGGVGEFGVYESVDYPLYKPVDWLIDETPLSKPLLWWAELWGVRRRTTGGAYGI